MQKYFDDECLNVKDVASVLELDTAQVYRLFKTSRIESQLDDNGKFYTKKACIIDYLDDKVPSGFNVVENSSLNSMNML